MKDIEVETASTETAQTPAAAGSQRAAYTAPVLHVYGSVSKLTMGTTGTGPDGVMMTMTGMGV